MMRPLAIAIATLSAAWALAPQPASAERLVTSLSRHQVLVSSNFTGASIVLFGTIEPDGPGARRRAASYDIVVTVTGPRQNAMARRKERVMGIWTNVDARTFVSVPTYLAVLSNRTFEEIAGAEVLRRLQIGFDNTLLPQQIGSDIGDVAREDPFRSNFFRVKQEQRLYVERTNGVTFLSPTVFQAEIPLPASAPVGNYDVEVKVFASGTLIVRTNSAFEIVKVGFEQFVASAARDHGLLYGIAIVIVAAMTGWLASVVFRRD